MKDHYIPEIIKLNNRNEFLYVSKFGEKAISDSIVLQVAKQKLITKENRKKDTIRLGYGITKKIGNAVIRNKIKRRLRAAVRNVLIENAKPGYDYVFIGRKKTVDYPFDKLNSELIRLLKKTNTWKN